MEEEKEIAKREEIYCLPELGGPATPWLIYPNGNTSHIFCNIFEPKKTCFKRIPEMRRKICVKSSHGWLVLLGSGGGCSLFNPVTLKTIHLPSADVKWEHVFDFLGGCTLLSAPTDPGSMVLFFCRNNQIIYCQPGDTQWTKQTYDGGFGRILHAIGFSDGTIYACTDDDHTVIIDKDSSGRLSFKLLNVILRPQRAPEMTLGVAYFFESCGELFRVHLYLSRINKAAKFIGVYKWDFSRKATMWSFGCHKCIDVLF